MPLGQLETGMLAVQKLLEFYGFRSVLVIGCAERIVIEYAMRALTLEHTHDQCAQPF